MKRISRAVLVIGAALALVLPIAGSASSERLAAAQSLDGEKIEVAAVWTGAEQKNFEQVLDEFEQADRRDGHLRVDRRRHLHLPRAAHRRAATRPTSRSCRSRAAEAVRPAGRAEAGRGRRGHQLDENYTPVWQELGAVDGKQYGVYFKAANKSLVWYNANVFEDAGVKPAEDLGRAC